MENIIDKLQLLNKEDKYILALSGGIDSVVLLDILSKANVNFLIAHCNFNLRDKESDQDELFVKKIVLDYNVVSEFISFPTTEYANNNKISIEMAARDLRYNWFDKLLEKYKAKAIFTAHHLNDSIETFFINLGRGSGLKGLSGIKEIRDHYYRPLIEVSRNDILTYAQTNKLLWREDSSNASNKYQRNVIRHNVIPQIQTVYPQFATSMQANMQRIAEADSYVEHSIGNYISKISDSSEYIYKVLDSDILSFSHPSLLLYYLLHSYGFTSSQQNNIFQSLTNKSNSIFYSKTCTLELSYGYLYLFKNEKSIKINEKLDFDKGESPKFGIKWEVLSRNEIKKFENNKVYFDIDKISFPLFIRNPKQADWFKPFGMNGKKRVNDYFKNIKTPSHKRAKKLLLVDSQDNIMWLIPEKAVDIYKVCEKNINVLVFSLIY